jgi:hypothetical protein
LQVSIIAPNGTQKMILNRSGGSGKHILTIFKDNFLYGTNDASGFLPPWSPVVKPDNAMGTFGNSSANGLWIIKVTDAASGDAGKLMEWGLMLNSSVGIHNIEGEVPNKYSLEQNYPNPFNPSTTIRFRIPKAGLVKIVVYDINGREVETLVNENLKEGIFNTEFDASKYSSGVYFYKLTASDYTDTKRMILIK